ncbi:MAG: hypothetical protein HC890_09725 [Chloroflexaceae bacterium]|nr:hypothetical protein [Chloroflexaceae bacterium]
MKELPNADKPFFSLRFTILIATILIIPFTLKTFFNYKLEPSIAVILPSGAGKINLNEEVISVRQLSLYGYDSQGDLVKIDPEELLYPLPDRFIYAIASNNFGLQQKKIEKIWIRGMGDLGFTKPLEIRRKTASPPEKKFAKAWMADKLQALELSPESFLVRYEEKEINVNTGEEVSRAIKNERIISLR